MRTPLSLFVLPCVGIVAVSLFSFDATAQNTAQKGEFSVERFEPAPGSRNYLSVEGARMNSPWGFTAGLVFDYARKPFVVRSCQSETNCDDPNAINETDTNVISDLFDVNLLASINPASFVQIGLRVPLEYVKGQGINADTGGPAATPIAAFGVGDPALEAKARFWGDPETGAFVLGGALDVSAPLGHATSSGNYIGNDTPVTVGLRGIFDGHFGPASVGFNLRGVWRKDATLGSTTIGPEARYGIAGGYQVSPVFAVLAEGYGGTRFSSKNGTNSLEIDGGFRVTPISIPLAFTLGGGAGVMQGVGVPQFRAIGGILWMHEVGDKDGDGIGDNDDQCPTKPEDKDGFEDADGCPDEDNDGDKIPDTSDKCPNQPETINGVKDDDGCPDELSDRDKDGIADSEDKCPDDPGKVRTKNFYGCPDKDQDGVPDKGPAGTEAQWDKCPDQAEDTDGFEDTDGCPDPDNDHDGIPDDRDECVDVPEVVNGFKDEDGCPDSPPDTDKDGIPDNKDKCPTKPENYNGFEDDDGCPDKGPQLVEVGEGEIKILQRVEFATGKDVIQGQKSFAVLDAVAGALKGHPEIFVVEVAGHTDNAGNAADNKVLSQKRAEAVMKYLVDTKGIDKNRLTAVGYGQDKPIADNKTPAAKQKNRRVEFTIVKSVKNTGTGGGTGEKPPPQPAPGGGGNPGF